MYKVLIRTIDEGLEARFVNKNDLQDSFHESWTYDELNDSIVRCICLECGSELSLEPDANTGWCNQCQKVVKVFNPVLFVITAA